MFIALVCPPDPLPLLLLPPPLLCLNITHCTTGRTARGERTGIAHTFFTPDNAGAAPALVQLLERSGQVPSFISPPSSLIPPPPPPPPPHFLHRMSHLNFVPL
jgi:hypothetical protein